MKLFYCCAAIISLLLSNLLVFSLGYVEVTALQYWPQPVIMCKEIAIYCYLFYATMNKKLHHIYTTNPVRPTNFDIIRRMYACNMLSICSNIDVNVCVPMISMLRSVFDYFHFIVPKGVLRIIVSPCNTQQLSQYYLRKHDRAKAARFSQVQNRKN